LELKSEISMLEIPTNKIFYDKKSNVLSIEILDYMFVGNYKKSTRLSKILDDIYASLGEIGINRENMRFVDFITNTAFPETTKLNKLNLLKKKEIEKEVEEVEKEEDRRMKKKPKKMEEISTKSLKSDDTEFQYVEKAGLEDRKQMVKEYEDKDLFEMEEEYEEVEELERDEMKKGKEEKPIARERAIAYTGGGPPPPKRAAAPPPPPGEAPSRTLSEPSVPELAKSKKELMEEEAAELEEESKPTVYEINMGLQYFSVMMEQRSYLFYVYFSHKELKIVDEEGKTVFETRIRIVTTKKEPPILNLKIEGEGFEVHPLRGSVIVKKDAVNPPVMIFSVLPTKSKKTKRKRKESERRFLNVYVEFENKVINHTILSIIVQPKFFRLDIGPLHLNVSKKAAMIISFISILIAGISLIYMLLSIDPSSTFLDLLSGFAPGLGSIVFVIIFVVTLFKEGVFPLKQKISSFLNFDQSGILIK
jgi:hypothetical protein